MNAHQRRKRVRSLRIPEHVRRAIQQAQALELDEAYDRFSQWRHSEMGRLLLGAIPTEASR